MIEDNWLYIESQNTMLVVIKTNYGTVYKRVTKYKPIKHPLVEGMRYKVEIYGNSGVLLKSNLIHFNDYYKRGRCFCCEFNF